MENQLRRYPEIPLEYFDWAWCRRPDYKPEPNIRTGSAMDVRQFLALKESIADHGLRNPLIVTYSDRGTPMNKAPDRRWLVDVGNNRSEALFQLGVRKVSAFLLGPDDACWPQHLYFQNIKPQHVKRTMREHFQSIDVGKLSYNDRAWLICKELKDFMDKEKQE